MTKDAARISWWFYARATRAARQRCDVDAPREFSADDSTRLDSA